MPDFKTIADFRRDNGKITARRAAPLLKSASLYSEADEPGRARSQLFRVEGGPSRSEQRSSQKGGSQHSFLSPTNS
jgi:hypothetical protein